MKIVKIAAKTKSYQILIEDSFDGLAEAINNLEKNYSKVGIISDDQVASYHLDNVKNKIESIHNHVYTYTFPHGEINKNLTTLAGFYQFLIKNQFDRKSVLIALGGGVTGDMVGFAAATFMRGIEFIQVPTSLLAQVDSSSGGKTGIDFEGYKNVVGAFYQPELVYINTNTLKTLPKNELVSGMAEVIKHAIIYDNSYFEHLEKNVKSILDIDSEVIAETIKVSCEIKSDVVSQDEKEHGLRAILNFGHTVGHAIERLKNFELLHGECVSIGIMAALSISKQLGFIEDKTVFRIENVLKAYHLPTKVSGLDSETIYEELFHDKKTAANVLLFILIERIGQYKIQPNIEKEIIIKAIQSVIK